MDVSLWVRFTATERRERHAGQHQRVADAMAATRFFTAFCTFSNARTSICRTRSRETWNSAARSSSVIGSSASRRASKMRRSRSLSVAIAFSR